jgi:serpin B
MNAIVLRTLASLAAACGLASNSHAEPIAPPNPAVHAVNQLGLDLHRQLATQPGKNLLISPWSIQTALAMTYAGAAGTTRNEMAKVLHFDNNETNLHAGFRQISEALAAEAAASDGTFAFNIANRLFGSKGFTFEKPFLSTVATWYGAPLEPIDFAQSDAATRRINGWVEQQTKDRIRDLIPPGLLNADTRLVLANALHLKAAWDKEFAKRETKARPFHVDGGATVSVPTLHDVAQYGYRDFGSFQAVSIPYRGCDLQFLAFVPKTPEGLNGVVGQLTAETFTTCQHLPGTEVDLFLPKLKLEPDGIALGSQLQALGLKSAFDLPPGSADFSRMANPSKDRLKISEVVHKTFLQLDEKGTEAAAATAVIMARATAILQKPKPVMVRIDRPFVFAIQHRTSGACLFLGQVTDPR